MTDRLMVERFISELTRNGEARAGYDVDRFLRDAFGQRIRAAYERDADGKPAPVTVKALAEALGSRPTFVLQALRRALDGVNYNAWKPRRSPWP